LSLFALAALSGSWVVWEIAVALAGVVASELLRRSRLGERGALWVVPALASAALVAVASAPSFPSELLAGLSGVTLLYWVAASRSGLAGGARSSSGLALPGLSVTLALLVTLFLPAGPARFGLASLVLVVVLLALGWAIRSDPAGLGGEAAR
jgi:hypothetical protein